MRGNFWPAVWLGLALAGAHSTLAAPAKHPSPLLAADMALSAHELETFVDGLIEPTMRDRQIAGVAIAVVQNGSIVLKKGYGLASKSPHRAVDADATLFHIGSITKTMTWMLLVKQIEAGHMSLDDPVNKHLPAELQIPTEGFAQPIRIRDLMTHQPGFEDRALGQLFERDPRQVRTLQRYLREERPRRVREPGTLSSYSNYGAALAGAVLEHVSGKPWQTLLESELILPLGLRHTSGREPYPPRADLPAPMSADLASQLSLAFGRGQSVQGLEYATQIAPAGAVAASAGDMAQYMLLLLGNGQLDGVRIYGADTARALRTPLTTNPATVGNWDAGFVDTTLPNGMHVYWHNGGTPTHFSEMAVIPDLHLGIFIAANTAGGSRLTDGFASHVVHNFYLPKPAPVAGSRDVATHPERYRGEFLSTRRAYHGLEGFLRSLTGSEVAATKDGMLVVGGNRYVPTADPVVFAGENGRGGIFLEMRGDRVERVVMPGAALERAGFWSRSSTIQGAALLTAATAATTLLGRLFTLLFANQAAAARAATPAQRRFDRSLLSAAGLWLISLALFAMWIGPSIISSSYAMFHWPSPWIIAGSCGAMAGATATAITFAQLPAAMMVPAGGGWPMWRRVLTAFATLVFGVFAVLLATKGALQPWNS